MTKSLAGIYDEIVDNYEDSRSVFDMTGVFDTFYQRFNISGGRVHDPDNDVFL